MGPDDTYDPVYETKSIEIHQQANPETGGPKVRNHLTLVDRLEPRHCLDFHDYQPADDQIQTLTRNLPLLVLNFYRFFTLERNAPGLQLETERAFLDRLLEAWAEDAMNVDAAPDGTTRQILFRIC